MSTLIHPCTHLSSCEPCCPLYDTTRLADLDAALDMTLVVVTRSSPRRRHTYALPPNSDAIFLTEAAKKMFLWPVVDRAKERSWPDGYDPKKHPPLNSHVLLEL